MKRVLSEYGLHWHLLKYNIPQNFPQGNVSLSLQTSNKAKHFLFIVVLYNCFRHFKLIYLLRESNASFYIVDAIVAKYFIERVAWLVRSFLILIFHFYTLNTFSLVLCWKLSGTGKYVKLLILFYFSQNFLFSKIFDQLY